MPPRKSLGRKSKGKKSMTDDEFKASKNVAQSYAAFDDKPLEEEEGKKGKSKKKKAAKPKKAEATEDAPPAEPSEPVEKKAKKGKPKKAGGDKPKAEKKEKKEGGKKGKKSKKKKGGEEEEFDEDEEEEEMGEPSEAPTESKKKKKGKKGKSKGGKKKGPLSKKDMELLKQKKKKEEEEKAQKEAEEKAAAEKKLAIEMERRDVDLVQTAEFLDLYDSQLFEKLLKRKTEQEWATFTECKNIPDFNKVSDVNSYTSYWSANLTPPSMKKFMKMLPEFLQLIDEMQSFLVLPPDAMRMDLVKELGLLYEGLVDNEFNYIDDCTYAIITDLTPYFEKEVGIVDYYLSIPQMTHCLWANLFLSPGINGHEFEELKFKFKIPESLLPVAGVYRLMKFEFDHFSPNCMTFYQPGIDNALKQAIVDWVEVHKILKAEADDTGTPPPEKKKKKKEKKGKGGRSKSKSPKGKKKDKGDKGGKSKTKEKGKSKERGKSKEKDSSSSKERSKSKEKDKSKERPKSKEKEGKGKGKEGGKAKEEKGDKGKKERGRSPGKKDRPGSKGKSKGGSGKGKKGKSKERRKKTEAELAKEREREEKAQFIPQLHETEMNLRHYTVLGGIFLLGLYEIPPQPVTKGNWVIHLKEHEQVLKPIPFEAEYTPPPPEPEGAKKTPEEVEQEAKEQEEQFKKLLLEEMNANANPDFDIPLDPEEQEYLLEKMKNEAIKKAEEEREKHFCELVTMTITAPNSALWFEPPIPIRWDQSRLCWSTEGFYDVKFNEATLQLSFRSMRFGYFAFGHNRWSNLPYQTWELRPMGQDQVWLSLVAGIAVVELTIQGDLICVSGLSNVTNDEEVQAALLNKYMKINKLIQAMRKCGLDLFPELDSYAYVDGILVKHMDAEDHLYQCMAIACSAYNFQWSRWNLLAGRDKMIYQMRERHGTASPGNFNMVLTTPRKTIRIDCTEVSPTYNENPVEEFEYYADLVNLVHGTATEEAMEIIKAANPDHIETVRLLLCSMKLLSFS